MLLCSQHSCPSSHNRPFGNNLHRPAQLLSFVVCTQAKRSPWWQKLYDLRVSEGGWEYPEQFTQADVRFLRRALRLRKPTRILDLGCGTGRHSIGLARLGHRVTGLDFSPQSMRVARKNTPARLRNRVEFVIGDMRHLEYKAEFEAVIMFDVSFGLFDQRTNLQILRRARSALRPGGRLLLELFNPKHVRAMVGHKQWQGDQRLVVQETTYDSRHKTLRFAGRSVDVRSGKVSVHPVQRLRVFTIREIRRMLSVAGLRFEALYAGHQGPHASARALTAAPVLMQVLARRAY